MPQSLLLRARGLHTQPNALGEVPEGALVEARNVVIDRDGVLEPRRGFGLYGSAFPNSSDRTKQLLTYKDRILRHYSSTLEVDSDGSGVFTSFNTKSGSITANTAANPTIITSAAHGLESGNVITITGSNSTPTINGSRTVTVLSVNTFSIPVNVTGAGTAGSWTLPVSIMEVESGVRIKGIEANANFFFTTSDGIKKLSATSPSTLSSTLVTSAGIPKGLDIDAALVVDAGGWFTVNQVVAYRIVWGIKDLNNNLILGAPGQRSIVQYPAPSVGNQNVQLTFPVPDDITPNHFYQIYRTAITTPETSDPGDEMNLVYEDNPSATQVYNKLVVVTDDTPDDFRSNGATLYTNPISGEGILQANSTPPLALDLGSFKNSLFLGNTISKHRKQITLLGVSDLTANVSTFTITDGTTTNTYTFSNTEDASLKKVLISAAATPAQQIDDTARSLVRVINRQSSEIVYADYISGDPDSLPGQILLESRVVGAAQFELLVNDDATTGIDFDPELPDSLSTFEETSDNEVSPNRLFFSKTQQPEAFPLINFIDVGPKDEPILRVLPLRDSLFILKQDSIWRLTGDSSTNFTITLFDNSTSLRGTDTATLLNNQIYMFSDQGLCTISDTGVSVISRPIENQVLKLPSPTFTNFFTASFGIGYESDRSYLIWTITNTSDTVATQCFRFNTFTNTWTIFPTSKTCGVVGSDDVLYLGAADTPYIEKERKTFSRRDYADRDFAISIPANSIDDTTISLSSVTDIDEGDTIVQTQYLTLHQFNTHLIKMDLDAGLASNDYFSVLEAEPSHDLTTQVIDLASKIDADASIVLLSGSITANTLANPTVITSAAHGLSTGRLILISGSNSTPSINGVQEVTVINANSFSVPVNVTIAGTSGSWTTSYTSIVMATTNSDLFLQQQMRFNNIVDALQTDPNVSGLLYKESAGSLDFEMSIIDVNTADSTVTLLNSIPFIAGAATLFNRIQTRVTWAPQHFGDVSSTKQVREASTIFEKDAFTKASIAYSSDLSGGFDTIEFSGSGIGLFGFFNWGNNAWGGGGTAIPIRTLIPREKQRCRFLSPRFEHSTALEQYALFGISFTLEMISSRGYK